MNEAEWQILFAAFLCLIGLADRSIEFSLMHKKYTIYLCLPSKHTVLIRLTCFPIQKNVFNKFGFFNLSQLQCNILLNV